MAAVKRIRDKTAAKKQARQTGFYDVNRLSDGKGCMYRPTRGVIYDMSSFLQEAVDKYRQLAGPEFQHLKKVSTPFYDDKIARPVDTEAECKGKLAPIASRVLMKLLFAARMARFDLLRAVQGLASRVTKWSVDCDCGRARGPYLKSDAQTLRRSDTQTLRRSDTQTLRHSDAQTLRHSDTYTIEVLIRC